MTETPTSSGPGAVHFATSLSPHRSLSPEGFKWVIRGAVAANLLIGVPMLILGAWPVMGFMGLDIWLLWWLFKRSYLDARRSETLVLTDSELLVDRVAPDGEREEHRLDAYWLRLDVTEERLVVVSKGNRTGRAAEVGAGRDARPAVQARVGLIRGARPSWAEVASLRQSRRPGSRRSSGR
jgi:uncharacterized membrane protein